METKEAMNMNDETKPAIAAKQVEMPVSEDSRRTLKVEPPQTGADPMRSRRGRPRKIDGSPSRRNPDRQVVGEVEFRKPASEINNLHAAFDRIAEQEKALHTRKVELAGQYEKEYGKKLRVIEPSHMLDAKTAAEKIPAAQGKALATALYAAPAALLGVEVRPKPDELAMLGDAIVDLSKFYSFADNEAMTWLAVGFAALACFAPAAAELRSKKAGTWETDKIALANAGYLPGVRP
jgi:hypothetical protein